MQSGKWMTIRIVLTHVAMSNYYKIVEFEVTTLVSTINCHQSIEKPSSKAKMIFLQGLLKPYCSNEVSWQYKCVYLCEMILQLLCVIL